MSSYDSLFRLGWWIEPAVEQSCNCGHHHPGEQCYLRWPVFALAGRFASPSLLCFVILSIHAATSTPSADPVHLMAYPSVIGAFAIPIVVRRFRMYPPHWLQRRKQSRGGSFLVMLRPARWLERLANPRPRLCAADRPARLRQSLPQPGSPPTGAAAYNPTKH